MEAEMEFYVPEESRYPDSNPVSLRKDTSPAQETMDTDEEDNSSYSSSGGQSSRVRERGPIVSYTPLIQNSSDPRESGDRTYDHTPLQGWKHLDEVFDLLLTEEEPINFKQAAGKPVWDRAMKEEIASIERNKTWNLTDLPSGHRPIGLKWIFKIKKDAKGNITRHKARLVAKGYIQEHGVDYDEVFAPVARLETIRLVFAISAQKGWLIHHLDVKTTFLHGELNEEVFVNQPEGFERKGQERKVYKLTKALYGLKQAPRAWNTKLDGVLKEYGFERCKLEQAVYKKETSQDLTLVAIYVDDLLVTGSNQEKITKFKLQMEQKFEMSDLGLLTYYLGLEVVQDETGIKVTQKNYAKKILKMVGLEDCNATKFPMEPGLKLKKDDGSKSVDATEYRKIFGSLRYLTHTRPDLLYAVGYTSRYMQEPKSNHQQAVKQILRYIKGTIDLGIHYQKGGEEGLMGYSDSSYSVDQDDGKSTTGAVFFYNEKPITWLSQKQQTVALSSCEAEFMAATSAACQAIWLRGLIAEITGREEQQVIIKVDNKSAIALMKNPVFHGRSKHINTRFHYIRECVERNQIKVEHISGEEQRADILTKALPKIRFAEMRNLLGVDKFEESKP
ncbi:hypothetical protein E3N88_25609 [Mikania micrantha]|uniref:Reverse transcriptase Ty1/copia-type domain-containing protein n=1 Tax=Mikania micrantha TaxID=192012 RepID=A0A5N6N802_9ASTR|nr:hypothetical protein E3N88_25609 [Mikania micrantha]